MRIALSAFLVFHLFAIFLAPNTQSYLGARMAPVFEPYLSFFEMTNSWSFFAPDPGPPPVFVEWELLARSGLALHRESRGTWPEMPDPFFFRERQNRRIAAAEFMIGSDERIEKMMVPYLCRRYPEASSVKLWRSAYPIPALEDVASGKRSVYDENHVERRYVGRSFCGDGA